MDVIGAPVRPPLPVACHTALPAAADQLAVSKELPPMDSSNLTNCRLVENTCQSDTEKDSVFRSIKYNPQMNNKTNPIHRCART